jgi:YbbR domain-containing protein
LINLDGEEVPAEGLVISPAQVKIQVTVEEVMSTLDVPIRPMIGGMLQTASFIRTVTIEPESVTVTGSQGLLSVLEQIDTEAIDISNITSDAVFYISLAVPEGIRSVSTDSVRVSVSVEPVMGVKEFENIPIEIRNAPFGVYASYAENTLRTVRVRGVVDALAQLERGGLSAFLDLTDMQPGTHMVSVTVQAPEGFDVEEITPDQIEVILTENQ